MREYIKQTGSLRVFIYLYITAISLIKAVKIVTIIATATLTGIIKLDFISHVPRII